MAFDIFLYDASMTPLHDGFIECLEHDDIGTKVDLRRATERYPNGYGAHLAGPDPSRPVMIWVNDNDGEYAPTSVGYLHGSIDARLDVTLHPLPAPFDGGGRGGRGGGGAGARGMRPRDREPADERSLSEGPIGGMAMMRPGGLGELISAAVRAGRWTEAEGIGVETLVEAVLRAHYTPILALQKEEWPKRWAEQLGELGIDLGPDAESDQSSRGRISNAGGGSVSIPG